MNKDLQEKKEEIVNIVDEFADLQDIYKIELEKTLLWSHVFAVNSLKEPWSLELLFYYLGDSWGKISLVIPIVLLLLTPSAGIINVIIATFFIFYIIALSRISGDIKNRRKYAKSDFDFVVKSKEGDLAHELGHIHLQGKEMIKYKDYQGFRNGLRAVLNLNVEYDYKVDSLLEPYGLGQDIGILDKFVSQRIKIWFIENYFGKIIGGFYRLFRII